MSWPFGETGCGKIGLRPNVWQELSANARTTSPKAFMSDRALVTMRSISTA
jgi:hypothetical protein